jgi:uncharacterized protein YndB with AHSA1/START domain
MTTVTAEKLVKAPLAQAYRAFTNSSAMRSWLCDLATVEPRPRGRIYLWWNGDFYSSGEYREVEENKKVSFLWHSRNETQPTLVTVTLAEQADGVLVKMAHTVPDEPGWEKMAEGFQQNWQWTLEALAFMLETGMDYRLANRPLLGIYPGDFTKEQAHKLGVPVTEGQRLDGVVAGMGAQKAGLQHDDVIVSMAGSPITNDFASLPVALSGKKGGDVVEVVFYRGPEKKTVQMELSRRPMVEVPFDIPELVKRARAVYEPALKDLEACFEGVSNAQALAKPAPGEWSALEVVAHIVQGERANRFFFDDIVNGYERIVDGFGGNLQAHIDATVKVYPTASAMLAELRRSVEETLAYAAALPPEFVEDKGAFYRLGSGLVQADSHLRTHIEQIQAALAAAGK